MNSKIWLPACLFLCAASAHAEIVTRTVSYEQDGVTFQGFLAYDNAGAGAGKAKRPGVLVVPEWWGLNDFVREKARALAEMGYVAFVADMYGEGRETTDRTEAGKWAGEVRGKTMRPRAQAALDTLAKQEQVDPARLAAIGFCFGGTTVLELAYSGADVKAVVSFHGGLTAPTPEDMQRIKAEVLVLHGAADPTVSKEQIEAMEEGLNKAKANWTMVVYSAAKHAFTNPAADRAGSASSGYNERAARNAWEQMKVLLKEKLS